MSVALVRTSDSLTGAIEWIIDFSSLIRDVLNFNLTNN